MSDGGITGNHNAALIVDMQSGRVLTSLPVSHAEHMWLP